MSVINTPAFAQYPRSYSVQVSAANTNTLLWTAGPDGTLLTQIAAVNILGGVAANLQFYNSPDGNTTTKLLPFSAATTTTTVSAATAIPIVNVARPDGTLFSPTSPLYLSGVTVHKGLVMSQSTLSNLSSYYDGGRSQGSANAQTLPFSQNSSGTIYLSTGVTNAIVDFEANFTNSTTTATIQIANAAPLNLFRDDGTAIQAGDLTAKFRYRGWVSGTSFFLLITQRMYVAIGAATSIAFTAWGIDG
jgi:hypothetical protein